MDGLGRVFDDDTGLGIQSTCATSGEGLYSHNIANKGAFENLGVAAIQAIPRDVDCGKYLKSFRDFGEFVKTIEPLKAYPIPLDEEIFGANVEVPLQRVDMEHISQMQQLSASCIMLYMSHLYRVMKSANFGRKFFFVNPSAISGAIEELVGGSKSALLANILMGAQNGELVFLPYNLGLHWILLVIHLSSAMVYYLDSLYLDIIDEDMKFIVNSAIEIYDSTKGNLRSPTWKRVKCPQQSRNIECGFYVLRFMKELISDQSMLSDGDFNRKEVYSKDEIDEVRFDWIKFVLDLDIWEKVGHREEDEVNNIGD